MGTDRSGTYLRGVLVPDPSITADNLVSKTDGTVPSTYSQTGAFTGPPEADQDAFLVLRTSGTQSEDGDLELRTQRSGGVGLEDAGFVWRDVAAGDTTSQYKGWDGNQAVTGWETLLYTTSAEGATIRPHVIRLQSGKLLASFSLTTLGVIRISRYDPSDSTWTSVNLGPTGAGAGYITSACTLVQIGSGRVLAFTLSFDQQQVDCYYSDDDGDNWSVGGYRILDTGVTKAAVSDMRAAWSPETSEILLLIEWDDGSNDTMAQYASGDLGASFVQIEDDFGTAEAETTSCVEIIAMKGGGFCFLYVDDVGASHVLARRRIGSAFSNLADATASTIVSVANPGSGLLLPEFTAFRDEDDTFYCYLNNARSDATRSYIGQVFRSDDQGDTWASACEATGVFAFHADTAYSTRLKDYSAMSLGGRVALVTRWAADTDTFDPNSVAVVWFGGYSTHTVPRAMPWSTDLTADDLKDFDYIAYGYTTAGSGLAGLLWLPVCLPDSPLTGGWTQFGTAGALQASSGSMQISTTAATGYYDFDIVDTDQTASFADFEVELDDGDGSTSAEAICFNMRLGNGTVSYEIQVRLASGAYRLYDVNAAANVGAAVTLDLTSKKHIRIAMDLGGNVKTWHCSDAHVREWTAGTTGTGLTDGGAAAGRIEFGHTGSTTGVSRWTMVGFCYWPESWGPTQTDKLAESWSNPTYLHPRSYFTTPALVHDGVQVAALSGPTFIGETYRIKARYEYPLAAIHPDASSSPQREWRSTADGSNMALVWDLESSLGGSSSFWESSSVGCFLMDSNLQSCKLQGWNGAAWVDILDLDASSGYSTLPYTRKGRHVYSSGGAPTGDAWSPHMMHAGDMVLLDGGGEDQDYRRIESNASGGWTGTATKLARLRLDDSDMDGTESASGNATIYRRNFGGVVHNLSAFYRYVRLYIPSQKTVDGYYKIGTICVGPVFVFGLQYGNGWAWEQASNVDLTTADSGIRVGRNRGRRRRAVELSWSAQPQDTSRMWDSSPKPDYVTGVTAGDPVASIADTAYQVLGLTERTDGPRLPVVYLGTIPRGTGTHDYTSDLQWLYGRIVTTDPSVDHVVGDEGATPVLRGSRLRIEEEV